MTAITSPAGPSAPSIARLADLGHELRTPLNAVIGLSTVLARELHGPLTDKQAEYVAQIEASGRHLLALVGDILDLARADADKLRADLVEVSLDQVVAESVAMVREQAHGRGLVVEVDVPSGLPPVRADGLRARQLLLNLLSNAVKFTEPGGAVGVSARLDGAMVAVDVWDTGIGIAAEHLDTVFAPFERIDSPLSRQHPGTGLGLPLARRLAALLGGAVTVRSTPGEGSVFTATFPLAAGAAAVVPDNVVPLRTPRDREPTEPVASSARLGTGRCHAELRSGRPAGGRDLDHGRGVRRDRGAAAGRRRVRDAGSGAEPDHHDRAVGGAPGLVAAGE